MFKDFLNDESLMIHLDDVTFDDVVTPLSCVVSAALRVTSQNIQLLQRVH